MKNLTLSIEEHLLARCRDQAHRMGKTLNQWVREVLAHQVDDESGDSAFLEMVGMAEAEGLKSADAKPLSREEAHERG